MKCIVIIEHPGIGPIVMQDEDEKSCIFNSLEEARNAVKGAMWEYKWIWWVVELEDGGNIEYGV